MVGGRLSQRLEDPRSRTIRVTRTLLLRQLFACGDRFESPLAEAAQAQRTAMQPGALGKIVLGLGK